MANSRIGVEQLTLSKILTDPAGGTTTYDVPVAISKKLIKIGVKNQTSAEPQFADDMAVDVYVEDGDITIEIDATDLSEDERALIMGQTMVAGVRTPNPATDVRPYFCVSWKSKKRNLAYKYYKILKVIFSEGDEDFETKQDKSAPQTDKISGLGIQRLSDSLRKRIADADSATWVAATGTGWFTSGDITPDVVAPTVTTDPADAEANVVGTANVVWTFSKAIQPALMTAANFFLMKADGTAAPGVLSINSLNTIVTLDPTDAMTAAAAYVAVATMNVKDMSGNALAATSITNFTIAA